jgi:hypothetical protein
MEIKMIGEQDKQAWDRYVREHPDSIAWQSYDWYSVVRKHYAVTFLPLAVTNGTGIRGVLPLYRIGSSRGKNVLISVPYAVAGGILADDAEAERLLVEKAVSLAGEYGSRGITLKQYKRKVAGDFRDDDAFYNRELDIARDLAQVWQDIDGKNKQRVEEARNYPLVLAHPVSDINTFYKLLLQHHHQKGVPCVSKRWIEDLINFDLYSAAVLLLNGRPVAGTLVKEFKDTVSFPFSCIARDDEQHRTFAYDLYWKLIARFNAKGTRIYHSGRIPANNDVECYRLGWGGKQYGYHYQYYPGGSTVRSESSKKGRKRELFESVWRRMPLGLAELIGPVIVRRFP